MAKECLDMAHVTCKYRRMRTKAISAERLIALRGKRSREDIAHELRKRGHGTDAKSIWRYETGRSNPLARLLPDYANILGAASVDELYASDGDEEDRTAPRSSPLSDDLLRLARFAAMLEKSPDLIDRLLAETTA